MASFTTILIRNGVIGKEQLAHAEQVAAKQSDECRRCPGQPGLRDGRTGDAGDRPGAQSGVHRPERDAHLARRSSSWSPSRSPGKTRSCRWTRSATTPCGSSSAIRYDLETFDKLRFILNRQIEIALAPREAILEAINRYYGQIEGESADSMLQEFTDTAIDFTETEDEHVRSRRSRRREQCPGRQAGPADDQRGRPVAGLGYPHRTVRGPGPRPLSDRRRAGRTRQPSPPAAGRDPQPHQDSGQNGHRRTTADPGRPDQDHGRRKGTGPARQRDPHQPRPVGRDAAAGQGQYQGRRPPARPLGSDLRKVHVADPSPQRDHPGDRPDRLRQDDDALRGAQRIEPARTARSSRPRTRSSTTCRGSIRWRSSTASDSTSPASFARCCGRPPTSSWSAKCAIWRPHRWESRPL